jgi:hypothetical protein
LAEGEEPRLRESYSTSSILNRAILTIVKRSPTAAKLKTVLRE